MSATASEAGDAWYRDGLGFSCTQCGRCCGGDPGCVWISAEEITGLARHLGLKEAIFRRRYTFATGQRGVSLKDKGPRENYHCVFYDSRSGCSVYAHRPRQCRTWPFWASVVATPDTWDSSARECPGMNADTVHSAQIIASTAMDDGIA